MTTTGWKTLDDGKRRMRVEYGLHAIGEQAPYFSITAEIERAERGRWSEDSCGCLHDEIREHFPQLAELIPLHLQTGGIPMHYQANGRYWLEHYYGRSRYDLKTYDPDPLEAFKSTVAWGTIPSDADREIPKLDTVGFVLMQRGREMVAHFGAMMAKYDNPTVRR